ncbi:hypothetical protein FANTH_12808 [Fusarium anthophilum]|uniref:Uncharacterized protein n=1 Tax=Fusarium anthophilum TaxID=48485 RepID=A0A8H4YR31_9HYPO|nr:hypothetical protein FANTH_12808 [Fusarium anthophilum]
MITGTTYQFLRNTNLGTIAEAQTSPRHENEPDASLLIGDQEAPVWQKINKWLPRRDAHQDFWWDVTGRHLVTMLHEAGYPLSRHWKWGDTNADAPSIRLSVEHIGPNAGTALDLYNRASTIEVMDHLHAADPSINPVWFKTFLHDFDPHNNEAEQGNWGSSLFTAYELGADIIAAKAYFIPRDIEVCQDFFTHGFERAMRNVYGNDSSYLSAFKTLSNFLHNDANGQTLRMLILGIDCMAPEKSRIKVYMRTPGTRSVTSFLSCRWVEGDLFLKTLSMRSRSCGVLRWTSIKTYRTTTIYQG